MHPTAASRGKFWLVKSASLVSLIRTVIFGSCFAALATAGQQHTVETIDPISKAQSLSLRRDRVGAAQVLVKALQKDSKDKALTERLKNNLARLTEIFYTEKAQRAYELADSLYFTSPAAAVEKYQEALIDEDSNLKILASFTRAQLVLGSCQAASANIERAEKLNPMSPEIQLLRAQALVCLKKYEEVLLFFDKNKIVPGPFSAFLQTAKLRALYKLDKFKVARPILADLMQSEGVYPEKYYLQWEYSKKFEKPDLGQAEKYIRICKSNDVAIKKKFYLEPNLCEAYKDVSEQYQKLNAGDSA